MIYRILADCKVEQWDAAANRFQWIPGHLVRVPRMCGGFYAMLQGFNLQYPEITEPRARFYFTERGWQELGREIVAKAKSEGHIVRVLRRKDPSDSQIIYKDDLQLAILPGGPRAVSL